MIKILFKPILGTIRLVFSTIRIVSWTVICSIVKTYYSIIDFFKAIRIIILRTDVIRKIRSLSFIRKVLVVSPQSKALVILIKPTEEDDEDSRFEIRRLINSFLEEADCKDVPVIILSDINAEVDN